MRVGYISERKTKITALIDPAQKNMYARKKTSNQVDEMPIASPYRKYSPISTSDTIIPDTP